MLGVSSEKSGGAERFFSDFHLEYCSSSESENSLYFFADEGTVAALKRLGKLKSMKRVVVLRNVSNRLKKWAENCNLLFNLLRYRISILHVTNYGTYYYNRLRFIKMLPSFIRPLVVVNIVDCEIPYALGDVTNPKHANYKERYMPLFNNIEPDAYYTWYELFTVFVRDKGMVKSDVPVVAVKTRFALTSSYRPAPDKEQHIVFAARLTEQKRPMMFVDAIAYLHNKALLKQNGWTAFIYGDGPLAQEIKSRIEELKLDDVLKYNSATDLTAVLGISKCFVSTQDYENFPSLSMNEAMSAGNAIVARNVGQTGLFVVDGKNGYLTNHHTAEGIASCLEKIILQGSKTDEMITESLKLVQEVHTPRNFIRAIDAFWKNLVT
jgi:glycosyltransferase involved in cell wall biosynthesis